MRLSELIENYIEHKRSLGMVFGSQAVILRAFAKAQGCADVAEVSPDAVRLFLDGRGPITEYWSVKYSTINGFYRFALNRNHVTEIPLPKWRLCVSEEFVPYIYTTDDMKRLLAAVRLRHRPIWLLEPHTIQTLLLLLYGTGLRVSEAVGLRLGDFDPDARVLTIRATKFFKSRFVPLGDGAFSVLSCYLERQWPTRRHLQITPLLSTRKAEPVSRQQAELAFKHVRAEAGICRATPARYQPRLHDLRHTFAVGRLLTWYREGKDVQRLLPHLSTYLGHSKIRHTQRYLTMTTELLEQASACFERYARPEVQHA